MPDQNIILGLPWMRVQNVAIHAREGTIEFKSHGFSAHQRLPEVDICKSARALLVSPISYPSSNILITRTKFNCLQHH